MCIRDRVIDDASDDSYAVAETTLVINNVAPVASINLTSGDLEEGSALLFEAEFSSDVVDADRHTFQWRVEKDGAEYSVTSESDAASFGFTPDDNGSYEVFVEVSDGEATVTSSQVFVVENVAPSVTNVNVTPGNEGEPVSYTHLTLPTIYSV